ncbi:hypothetical protein IQ270_25275 [Microcoleus sp. LEGE 07076]|uniref:hypothetical protein n=1 Tax=Microcoleus sp. LEGE 07076 TaxID=915322 RepID=UPI0018828F41|nr:hypothetical protein [Microcoleus sp. LEGE 07076]MBE9187862.1 hypothetical protein [Microcoleus sp. LEGE 07076]
MEYLRFPISDFRFLKIWVNLPEERERGYSQRPMKNVEKQRLNVIDGSKQIGNSVVV